MQMKSESFGQLNLLPFLISLECRCKSTTNSSQVFWAAFLNWDRLLTKTFMGCFPHMFLPPHRTKLKYTDSGHSTSTARFAIGQILNTRNTSEVCSARLCNVV